MVAVCDPVYPVYVDTNAMAGRAGDFQEELGKWSKLVYMPCVEENGFTPQIPQEKVDMIYLCFPNNPTGTVATEEPTADEAGEEVAGAEPEEKADEAAEEITEEIKTEE